MCGVSALFSPNGSARLAAVIAMNDLIRHRGPDSEGYVVITDDAATPLSGPETDSECLRTGAVFAPVGSRDDPGHQRGRVVLGHRRLSIIDLTGTGHQPMCSPDGRVWLTFNGEIYNFVELREELERLGHSFVGTSDTEVLLTSYLEWGQASLARLRGMFAFVLVDRESRTAYAVRDRFGIKPLYYARTADGGLAIGSEAKQVLPLLGSTAANGPRIYDFLNFAVHDHTDETMFAAVRQVPPGGILRIPLGDPMNSTVARWWALQPRTFAGTLEEASVEFAMLMRQSVREHLRSDVPVGACLSGGLDSSTLVCLAQEQLGGTTQRTYTATSSDRRVDETDWARIITEHVDAQPFTIEPRLQSLPELLPLLSWQMDEPFGSTSVLAQWSVFELAARSGTKVMLDGQGADEQLAGYLPYFAWRLVELGTRGQIGAVGRELAALRSTHPQMLRRIVMLVGYLMAPPSVGRSMGRLAKAPGQFPDAWLSRSALGVSGWPDPLDASGARARSVQGLALSQLTRSNLPMLLRYEDRDSMAHSVESRVPFLDHRLVEFTTSLPSSYLISQGQTKRVLREAMRGVLPEETRTRVDKIGFQTAEEMWVRESSDIVRGMLAESIESLGGGVKSSALGRFDDVISGREPFDHWIWRVISAGAWARRFGVRF